MMLCIVWTLLVITGVSAGAVQIIGHRGAAYVAPENTLISVKTAWKLAADAVEVDVHLTKDNRIVVIHDPTTGRTAGVDLVVNQRSAEDLRKLDVGSFKGERFAGQKIPFLEEIIESIPRGRTLFVEIKCGKEILPFLEEIIRNSGKASQIVIISFGLDVVSEAKKRMPKIPVYWLKATAQDEETGKPVAHGSNLIEIIKQNNLDGLDVHHAGVDKDFADAVKSAGLKLYVWTVNDLAEARRLKGLGVDGITTDRPGWLRKELQTGEKACRSGRFP